MISLLVPSRGRPEQLVEMWHTAVESAADQDDIELVVRIDSDDRSYDDLRRRGARGQVRWVSAPRVDNMSSLWNDAHTKARGDIFMHCADDIRFRTDAWDLYVKTEFDKVPDRIAFVYGRDGAHDRELGTHGFLSKEWVDIVGYFLPPYFSCDYADTWLNTVADQIERKIYNEYILTEHMHPALGKGEVDQTHRDRFARDARDNNTQRWHDLAYVRAEWIAQLLGAISHPVV